MYLTKILWHNSEKALTLCLFHWKTLCKDSFPHFPVFGSIFLNKKKIVNKKLYLFNKKTLTKIKLIFYRLFSKNKILENNLSLAQHITLIARSLFLFLLTPSLSLHLVSSFLTDFSLFVSLLSFLSISLPLCNTIFWILSYNFFFLETIFGLMDWSYGQLQKFILFHT